MWNRFLAEGSSALFWSRVVRCLSFVRPSWLTFHIFDFFSEATKPNSTKLDRKQDLNRQRPLPSLCFSFPGRIEN